MINLLSEHHHNTLFLVLLIFGSLAFMLIFIIIAFSGLIRLNKKWILDNKKYWKKIQSIPIKNGLNNFKNLSERIYSYSEKYLYFDKLYRDIHDNLGAKIVDLDSEINKKENQKKHWYLYKLCLEQKAILKKYDHQIGDLYSKINSDIMIANKAFLQKSNDQQKFINIKKMYAKESITLQNYQKFLDKEIEGIESLFYKYNAWVGENPSDEFIHMSNDINGRLHMLQNFINKVPPILMFINKIVPLKIEDIHKILKDHDDLPGKILNYNSFTKLKNNCKSVSIDIVKNINEHDFESAMQNIKKIESQLSEFEDLTQHGIKAANLYKQHNESLIKLYNLRKKDHSSIISSFFAIQKDLILLPQKIKILEYANLYWSKTTKLFDEYLAKITNQNQNVLISEVIESISFLTSRLIKYLEYSEELKKILHNTKKRDEWKYIFNNDKDIFIKFKRNEDDIILKKVMEDKGCGFQHLSNIITAIESELAKIKSNELYLMDNLGVLTEVLNDLQSNYLKMQKTATKVREEIINAHKLRGNDTSFDYKIAKAKSMFENAQYANASELIENAYNTSKIRRPFK